MTYEPDDGGSVCLDGGRHAWRFDGFRHFESGPLEGGALRVDVCSRCGELLVHCSSELFLAQVRHERGLPPDGPA